MSKTPAPASAGDARMAGKNPVESEVDQLIRTFEDFSDPSQERRRLFSELLGTFFLVLVAAGGG